MATRVFWREIAWKTAEDDKDSRKWKKKNIIISVVISVSVREKTLLQLNRKQKLQ